MVVITKVRTQKYQKIQKSQEKSKNHKIEICERIKIRQ